ncbi:alanine racemase [bacterium]|nr:alanine racemase [bacterium]
MSKTITHDLWVEVDISALKHNFEQIKRTVGSVKVMAVVKSNGFGHGYVEPARAFIEAGADALAVTRLDEAMILRDGGINAPILLFAPIQAENADVAINAGLDMTVSDIALARKISEAAVRLGTNARVHIKVDTGMGRLGVSHEQAVRLVQEVHGLANIQIAGIYTHFATAADKSIADTQHQLDRFKQLLERLDTLGIDCGTAHAANSAAILRLPKSHLGMVRPGTLLYGQYPSRFVPHRLDLKPTWKLKARICEIKELQPESPVGYGGEFITKRLTRTAVIPVGYADGFTLAAEGPIYRQSVLKFAMKKMRRRLTVEINGHKAPVLGRVAMQMIVIDITDIPDAKVSDEVTIPAMRIPTSALIPREYV